MYNIQKRREELELDMEIRCKDCGFAMKCENRTNSEAYKCFRYFIEQKVNEYLFKNKMSPDMWTCYGKISIDDLIHLLMYLEKEAEE